MNDVVKELKKQPGGQHQPGNGDLHAGGNRPQKMYRMPEVERLTGFRRSTIYNKLKAKTFPKPIRISARCVAWREADLVAWQEAIQGDVVGGGDK